MLVPNGTDFAGRNMFTYEQNDGYVLTLVEVRRDFKKSGAMVAELARRGDKLMAIKTLRQMTDLGLKDAKDIVEAMIRD